MKDSSNNSRTPPNGGACYDIAISGGGMVGMSLGVALARAGMRVALIEKGALPAQLAPNFDGRVSAIALGSKYILDHIGAWEAMAPHAEPILDIRVSDGHTPVFLHYDHKEVGSEPFGYIVENRRIRHALQEAAAKLPTLTLLENTEIDDFEAREEGVRVASSGGELHCKLLIGAEGRQSKTRELAGIGAVEWPYRQTAIVCTIAHELPHHGLAQERFLPAGPFAVLPMQPLSPSPLEGEGGAKRRVGGDIREPSSRITPLPNPPPQGGRELKHRSSLVWVEPRERAPIYLDLPEEECVQEIRERVGDYLGEIRLAGPRFSYPLSLLHAKEYTGRRVALAGDAAHGMHPIAGQGVNLGFRDVGVLAELLGEAFARGEDVGAPALLAHYARWRRFDNVAMLAATDLLNRLFCTSFLPIKIARDAGLWTVGRMPPVKRFFMRHAMGLVGDLPKILANGKKS